MTTLIGVESVPPSSARGVRASSPERDLAPTNVASGVSAVAVYLDVPGSPPADPAETTTRPHRSASSASAAPPLNRFTDLPFLWGGRLSRGAFGLAPHASRANLPEGPDDSNPRS